MPLGPSPALTLTLTLTRNLSMIYSTGVAFSTHAPLTVTHPTGCTEARLAVQMDAQVEGDLIAMSSVSVAQDFTLQGVQLTSRLQALPDPSTKICVKAVLQNRGFGWISVQDARAPSGGYRTLQVGPDMSNSKAYIQASSFAAGPVLFEECFDGFVDLKVWGTDSDAATLYIAASDDGGATYNLGFACSQCSNANVVTATAYICLDTDSSNTGCNGARCLNGDKCILTLGDRPPSPPPSPPPPSPP